MADESPKRPVPVPSRFMLRQPTLADTVCDYCGLPYREHPESLARPGYTAICNKEPVRL